MNSNKHMRSLLYIGLFLIAWATLTIWLNLEHQKEISIISRSHDLALRVTHTSDVLISSHVTEYPNIHEEALKKYSIQILELKTMRNELESLWPKTPESLVNAIEEMELAYVDLLSNTGSYSLHKKFSEANVYYKNMSYHEYSLARRDMLHKNLPLFLILGLLLLVGLRYLESIEFNWITRRSSPSKLTRNFSSAH